MKGKPFRVTAVEPRSLHGKAVVTRRQSRVVPRQYGRNERTDWHDAASMWTVGAGESRRKSAAPQVGLPWLEATRPDESSSGEEDSSGSERTTDSRRVGIARESPSWFLRSSTPMELAAAYL